MFAVGLCHFNGRPQSSHNLVKVLRLMVPVLICLWISLKSQPEHEDLRQNVLEPWQSIHQSFKRKVVGVEWRVFHLCQC